MKIGVQADWEDHDPSDEPPLHGAVLETRDWWDHRTRMHPNRVGWYAVGRDHRRAHPRSGAAMCRRILGATFAGPFRVWMLEVPDLAALARLMADLHPCELTVNWACNPDGHELLLRFGRAVE